MRQIFLDTETTGLSPESGDRIIEIGCVEMVNRRLTGRNLHFYVNPERRNSEDAFKVHGLSDEFLADKPLFAHDRRRAARVRRAAPRSSSTTPRFDVGFLDAELRRIGRPAFTEHVGRVTDSLSMARDSFPGKSNSLDALCKRLEVNNADRELHGALLDAGLLAEVYIRMTRGQDSLVIDAGDALAADLAARPIDFSALELIVIAADDDELAAHAAVLAEIDKASGGRAVWRPRAAVRDRSPWHNDAFSQAAVRAPRGAVSSGVEHDLHTDGVAGSKPSPPTTILAARRVTFQVFAAPSAPTCRPPSRRRATLPWCSRTPCTSRGALVAARQVDAAQVLVMFASGNRRDHHLSPHSSPESE